MKVILNRKYGGFGLSQKALERLKKQGWTVTNFKEDHTPIDRRADLLLKPKGTTYGHVSEEILYVNWWKHQENSNEFRTRPDLIALIEKLGHDANGKHANLQIEQVDNDYYWEVKSFDGMEKIKYGSLKEDW
jgi:hypothetical protein